MVRSGAPCVDPADTKLRKIRLNAECPPKNARTLRRLAADHHALRTQPLPPNYLFPPGGSAHSDELTSLDILLAGPSGTPFAQGVWKLHLALPAAYPQQPPSAHFRTPIFHPNVDAATGAVCVETLKRDWHAALTLRDVLVTLSCLLIQPNADSALNADAAALLQHEGYAAFAARAAMLAGIQAKVPRALVAAVREAQARGEEEGEKEADADEKEDEEESQRADDGGAARRQEGEEEVPVRRRRTIARVRAKARRDEGSPSEPIGARRRRGNEGDASGAARQPFVFHAGEDDVFGFAHEQAPSRGVPKMIEEEDESMTDADQENDSARSPTKAGTPKSAATPRRPHGAPVPLGELILEDEPETGSDTSEELEPEYPPSPRKSPSKSPAKCRQARHLDSNNDLQASGSSRNAAAAAAARARNVTPPNETDKPLAEDSPFAFSAGFSPSPRTARRGLFQTPLRREQDGPRGANEKVAMPQTFAGGVTKTRSPSSRERKRSEHQRKASLDAKLWELCGRDIIRWNIGDFDGQPFKLKAARW